MYKKPHAETIRSSNTVTLKEGMQALLKSYRLDRKFDETQLILAWEKLMGKSVARRTERLEVRNHVLVVTIKSAPLKHELNHSCQKVMDLIQKEFGKTVIKEVLFV